MTVGSAGASTTVSWACVNRFQKLLDHGQSGDRGRANDKFRIADHTEVIAWWLESEFGSAVGESFTILIEDKAYQRSLSAPLMKGRANLSAMR